MDSGCDISAIGFEAILCTWKRKITLALTIPPEHGGGKENMMGQRKRDNEMREKNCLDYRGRTREGWSR